MESKENTARGAEDTQPLTPDISRRHVLTRAGIVAAGVGLAGGSVQETTASGFPGVGVAHAGEFVMRVLQSGSQGETFTSVGYLTQLAGADASDLFSGTPHDVSTALFTTYTTGSLVERIVDGSLRALDVAGSLTIYQRSASGANYNNPSSFQQGAQVAQFDITIQNVLTVFAPQQGLPVLSGSMRQTKSAFVSGLHRHFGRIGMNARVSASGIGALTDPVTLNATLQMAGNWVDES